MEAFVEVGGMRLDGLLGIVLPKSATMLSAGRILLLSLACLSSVRAQSPREGRYHYPLHIPARLNANFGEMRPNHFHMGLDLFTERRTGLPVLAADDGYVGRVKVEPGGFGRAIYLYHPDGTTTLYAHMERFEPALEEAVRRRQYALETWQMEWELPRVPSPYAGDSISATAGIRAPRQARMCISRSAAPGTTCASTR